MPAGSVSVNVTVFWPTYDRFEPPVENRFETLLQLSHTIPTSLIDLYMLSRCPSFVVCADGVVFVS